MINDANERINPDHANFANLHTAAAPSSNGQPTRVTDPAIIKKILALRTRKSKDRSDILWPIPTGSLVTTYVNYPDYNEIYKVIKDHDDKKQVVCVNLTTNHETRIIKSWLCYVDGSEIKPPKSKEDEPDQKDFLFELAEKLDIFRDQDGRGYATITRDGHEESHAIGTRGLRSWFVLQYHENLGGAPSDYFLKPVFDYLQAKAESCPKQDVFFRVGADNNGIIYIDIGDDDYNFIKITPEGWSITKNPPVKFRRSKSMGSLPIPDQSGSIETLYQYANLYDDELILLVALMVSYFFINLPMPILALSGEAGSSKSTLTEIIKRLIDPNSVPLRGATKDPRSVAISTKSNYVITTDNASYVTEDMFDVMCRLASKYAHVERELYTDFDEIIFSGTYPQIINGIPVLSSRFDFNDRGVALVCQPIEEEDREEPDVFWRKFEADAPKIFGGLLNLVAEVMRIKPSLHLDKTLRMATLCYTGEAVARILGREPGKFMKIYSSNVGNVNQALLDDSLVYALILKVMRPSNGEAATITISKSMKDWFNLIKFNVGDNEERKSLPHTPRGLGSALRRMAAAMRADGTSIDFGDKQGHGNVGLMTISRAFPKWEMPKPLSVDDECGHADFGGH